MGFSDLSGRILLHRSKEARMENSWIVFILINVVLALGVSIAGNFATPLVKALIDKSIFSSKKMRIASIIKDYKRMKEYNNSTSMFVARLFQKVFTGIIVIGSMLATLAIFLFTPIYFPPMSFLPTFIDSRTYFGIINALTFTFYLGMLYFVFIDLEVFTRHVRNFDKYKEKTIKKLKKLGGDPEDLDKEETAKRGGQNGME